MLLWNAVLVWNVSIVVFFASVAIPLKFFLKSSVANSGLSLNALSSLGCFISFASCLSLLPSFSLFFFFPLPLFSPLGSSHLTFSSIRVNRKREKTDKPQTSNSFSLSKGWGEAFEIKCWAYNRNSVKKNYWLLAKSIFGFSFWILSVYFILFFFSGVDCVNGTGNVLEGLVCGVPA